MLATEPKAPQTEYERGYRRGRIEAAAELHALYRQRILDATAILSAPVPQVSQIPSQAPAKPAQEKK